MAPNVLLVVLDAARRDALTPYGAPADATPVLADLARRGHALPLAYATSSWTLPSHASLFSGRLPRSVGLTQPPGGEPLGARRVLETLRERLLPEVLRRAGYRTEGFSANLWASGHAGFDVGFDRFVYDPSDRVERTNAGPGWRASLGWAREGLRSRGDDGAGALRRALLDSIAAADGRPTFWFVNLLECHSPYLPPRPWNDLGPAGRVRAALDAQRYLGFVPICLQVARRGPIPADVLARLRHLYGRAISYMDAILGDVLSGLDGRGMLEQTLVIVTADHGESFGEEGLLAHGFSLGEQLIHVPLLLAGPGARGAERVFSLAELPALVAAAAGLEPAFGTPEVPAGIAVAQYEAMAGAEDPRVQRFAAEHSLEEAEVQRLSGGCDCATDGRWKLVVTSAGQETLFDLESDPAESRPLPAGGSEAAVLRTAIDAAAAQAGSALPAGAGAPAGAAEAEDAAAIERQMRLLGYM